MSDLPAAAPELAEEVRQNAEEVRARVAAACRRAGRAASDVTLVAVSKTFPPEAVAAASEAGLEDFGENRVQELVEKAEALPGIQEGGSIRWHMIGHLQRNKAKEVVRVADLFHALDSLRLARELEKRAAQAGRQLPCLIQVNTSGEDTKSGVDPAGVSALVDAVAAWERVELRGFMTIAAPVEDPEDVRPEFRLLSRIRDEQAGRHPQLNLAFLSMGMSGDFEVAIEEGATHVRIGSAIFGGREKT